MSVRQVGADCRSARSIVLSWSYGRLVQYWFNKEEEEEEEEEKEKTDLRKRHCTELVCLKQKDLTFPGALHFT